MDKPYNPLYNPAYPSHYEPQQQYAPPQYMPQQQYMPQPQHSIMGAPLDFAKIKEAIEFVVVIVIIYILYSSFSRAKGFFDSPLGKALSDIYGIAGTILSAIASDPWLFLIGGALLYAFGPTLLGLARGALEKLRLKLKYFIENGNGPQDAATAEATAKMIKLDGDADTIKESGAPPKDQADQLREQTSKFTTENNAAVEAGKLTQKQYEEAKAENDKASEAAGTESVVPPFEDLRMVK